MAKRKRKKASMPRWPVAVLVVAVIAAALWFGRARLPALHLPSLASAPAGVLAVDAAHVDKANDGRRVRITGLLAADGPVRDAQLGVSAAAAVLLRNVEMYQWREHCAGAACKYDTGWGAPSDSRKFREAKGHENPSAPFATAAFVAPGLKLGAFAVDSALLAAQHAPQAYPVSDAGLPPNLAASFSAVNGALYAGGDSAQPQVGMLRVSYRVVPLGAATLEGVQRDGALSAK
ncbi:MAG TPA: TMEM43 family protein [Rudaea sp.]|nr:TMEM43 family protein [Rudaea sp.]